MNYSSSSTENKNIENEQLGRGDQENQENILDENGNEKIRFNASDTKPSSREYKSLRNLS